MKAKNILSFHQIAPSVKQLYTTVSEIVQVYLDGAIDAAAHFTAMVMDFIEKHKSELQELTNIFTEIFKGMNGEPNKIQVLLIHPNLISYILLHKYLIKSLINIDITLISNLLK